VALALRILTGLGDEVSGFHSFLLVIGLFALAIASFALVIESGKRYGSPLAALRIWY
jgi:hypothetical protein